MKNKQKPTTFQITLTGILAAAVYVASAFMQIPIPTVIGSTRLHMGNVVCLLSGILLGPVPGGLAAGAGSMLFDLTNPAYLASAPFTFLFKFTMAWICGTITRSSRCRRRTRFLLGTSLGAFAYVLLYLGKGFLENRFVLQLPLEAVLLTLAQKAAVSSVNALVSIAVAVPLGLALEPVIRRFQSDLQG